METESEMSFDEIEVKVSPAEGPRRFVVSVRERGSMPKMVVELDYGPSLRLVMDSMRRHITGLLTVEQLIKADAHKLALDMSLRAAHMMDKCVNDNATVRWKSWK